MEPIRVLIVDDSAVFRRCEEAALKGLPDIAVVGSLRDGAQAVDFIGESPVDVVILDLEMPIADGREVLARIRLRNASRPGQRPIGVIMLSAHIIQGGAHAAEFTEAGAFDVVAKPAGTDAAANLSFLRTELPPRIRRFVVLHQKRAAPHLPLAPQQKKNCRAIVIGVSTGGPVALAELLPALCKVTSLPILVVQHIPAGASLALAASLARKCSHSVKEASAGETIKEEAVYLAPGGHHFTVARDARGIPVVRIVDTPPENSCRPSVDVLFRSVTEVYRGDVIALILTGMGSDGALSLRGLKTAGAHIIAQDEKSSVVWGMAGAAAATGFVDEILPLAQIPEYVGKVLGKA